MAGFIEREICLRALASSSALHRSARLQNHDGEQARVTVRAQFGVRECEEVIRGGFIESFRVTGRVLSSMPLVGIFAWPAFISALSQRNTP